MQVNDDKIAKEIFSLSDHWVGGFSFLEIPTGFIRTKITLLFARENLVMDLSVYPEDCNVFCADGATRLL